MAYLTPVIALPTLKIQQKNEPPPPGIEVATSKICRERKGRDVYVVGAANVGKSAFVRAMLKEMSRFEGSNFDPAAMANSRWALGRDGNA